MKKGINIWSFANGNDVRGCMELAKKAGFDGIELEFAVKGPLSMESTDEEILTYKSMAEEIGITIGGLACAKYQVYSLSSNYPAVREKAKALMRRHLEAAKLLGVSTILTVPMNGNRDFGEDPEHPDSKGPLMNYVDAYDRAVEGLKEIAPYAEELGVTIGIENVWNGALLSPLEARSFIDAVGSPNVGMYLDVGNMRKWSTPEQWIQVLGKRIHMVHVKDFRVNVGTFEGFVDLLEGDVDFDAVMRELKACGYDGWLFAEMWPPYRKYPHLTAWAASKAMDAFMGRGERDA